MSKIEQGSSNVYADLGLENAEEMLVKAPLATKIGEIIKRRKLTQVQAAELLGMTHAQTFQFAARTVSRYFRIQNAGMPDPLGAQCRDRGQVSWTLTPNRACVCGLCLNT